MKIAHVFATNMAATYKLATMILPQLEGGPPRRDRRMFFFDDDLYYLRRGEPVRERLARIARERNILLMICDQCAVRRGLAEGTLEQCGRGEVCAKGTVEGVQAGCFPQLYAALAGNPPDLVVTL